MAFENSGLPQNALLREVYDYVYEEIKGMRERIVAENMKQINGNYRANLANLKTALDNASITEEKYQENRQMVERRFKGKKEALGLQVDKMLEQKFSAGHVAFAAELFQAVEGLSSEAVAVVLIGDCMRSARDYLEIEKRFGSVVAEIARDIQHARLYPEKSQVVMGEEARPDTRRLWLGMATVQLEGMAESIAEHRQMNPGEPLIYTPTEMDVYSRVKSALGIDPALDRRLVDAFNNVARVADSEHRLERNTKGEITLHQAPRQIAPPKTPPTPPPGGGDGNGGLGPKIFD